MANEEQVRLWNEVNAERWLRLREPMTRPLLPWGNAALEALAPQAGESALDVGCGCGDTTVALARRTGRALGVDVCEPFLRIAREEAVPGARYLLADAQTHRFEEQFDLCFSRFGLMFFEDPAAAFANLRSAMRPGGRFAAAVWGPWQDNEWGTLPMRVLRAIVPSAPPEPARGPGPFALSGKGQFARLLEGAGFNQVSVTPLEFPFMANAAQLAEQGPAAAFLRTTRADERARARFSADLAAAMNGKTLRGTALLAVASIDTSE